jgi:hypothetical protein
VFLGPDEQARIFPALLMIAILSSAPVIPIEKAATHMPGNALS